MDKIAKFQEWLGEDAGFSQVGAPPAGNVSGMGDVVAPTSTSTGSGDAWPSLGAPSSLVKLMRKRRKRKRAKKLTEGADKVIYSPDEDPDWIRTIAAALNFSSGTFAQVFSDYVTLHNPTSQKITLPSTVIYMLMEAMADGKYEFKVHKKLSPDDKAAQYMIFDGTRWDLFGEGSFYVLYFKELDDDQLRAQSKTAAKWLQAEGGELSDRVKEGILKLIRPEDLNTGKLKGMKVGLI